MKKRVYTLYRVSTIGQVEKDDIPMQKEACHEFAERQGWEIVKEFSEKGVSGFKKSAKDRDQLQLLQQAAAAGEFDVLLVFMFDRLGRRDDETPFIVEWFTKQGVEVWSVNEGQQRFDTRVILSMATLKKNALSCGSSSRKYLKRLRSCGMPAAERRVRTQIRTVLMLCFVVKCSVPTAAIV